MEECVLGCLAAACVGLESADVLRAYRQVLTQQDFLSAFQFPCTSSLTCRVVATDMNWDNKGAVQTRA